MFGKEYGTTWVESSHCVNNSLLYCSTCRSLSSSSPSGVLVVHLSSVDSFAKKI